MDDRVREAMWRAFQEHRDRVWSTTDLGAMIIDMVEAALEEERKRHER